MRRFWLGISLLSVLLVLGFWLSFTMSKMPQDVSKTLTEASELILAGDISGGISLAQQAQENWDFHWYGTASVADHAPMDDIDGLFAQLTAYGQAGQYGDFGSLCNRIAQLVEAVGEAHSLSWWNIL